MRQLNMMETAFVAGGEGDAGGDVYVYDYADDKNGTKPPAPAPSNTGGGLNCSIASSALALAQTCVSGGVAFVTTCTTNTGGGSAGGNMGAASAAVAGGATVTTCTTTLIPAPAKPPAK
jgi:hypothetical protein